MKPLTALMDNVLAWRLGEVAREAGNPKRKDVGDLIDRGLILRRLLEEKGFVLFEKETFENSFCQCGIDSMPMNEYGKMICNCCHKPVK